MASTPSVAVLRDEQAALALLKAPRRRILELATEPISAVEAASHLGLTRQRIGYHMRELVRHGLLDEVDGATRGAVTEKSYRASASAYVLSPELLGHLAAQPHGGDAASAAHLLGETHRVQREVADALARAASSDGNSRVPTLSLSSVLRFADADQRGAFARALTHALADVVARFSESAAGPAAEREAFRMTVLLHPTEESDTDPTPQEPTHPGDRS